MPKSEEATVLRPVRACCSVSIVACDDNTGINKLGAGVDDCVESRHDGVGDTVQESETNMTKIYQLLGYLNG